MLVNWNALNRSAALLAVLVFVLARIEALAEEVVLPPDPDVLHRAAYAQYVAKQWHDAAASFHHFAAKFPTDDRALDAIFLEAEALHAEKQYASATVAFGEYLRRAGNREILDAGMSSPGKKPPYVARAMFRRGESAFFAGKSEAAREALWQFRERFPDDALNPFATRLLSDIATRELEQFVSPLRSAQNDVRDDDVLSANERVKETLSSNPPEPVRMRALYLDGQIAALRGDWENTRESMSKCLVAETLSKFSAAEIAEAHFWYAESLFRLSGKHAQNKPPTVQQAFAAAAKYPESKWAGMVALRLAQLQADREEWAAALSRADSIAATYPNFELQFEVDHLIGRALAARGEFDRARESFRRAINHPQADGKETAAIAQWRIGETLLHQHRYEEALTEFLRLEVLHQWPELKARGVFQAGECYRQLQRRRSAIDAYTRVISDYAGSTAADDATVRLAEINSPTKSSESATAGLSVRSPR